MSDTEKTFKMPTGEEFAKYLFDNPCVYLLKTSLDSKINLVAENQAYEYLAFNKRLEKLEDSINGNLKANYDEIFKCEKCGIIKDVPLKRIGTAYNFVLCDRCIKKLLELIK